LAIGYWLSESSDDRSKKMKQPMTNSQ
jgi:hypothetical protein